MATQSYVELQKQISALQAQAEELKSEEVAGVVTRIKEAISSYGLTPQDLFGGRMGGVAKSKGKAKNATSKASAAKYIDGKGGQWVGRGKRPKWLSDALASGRQLGDFLSENFQSASERSTSLPSEGASAAEKSARKKAAKTARKVKKLTAGSQRRANSSRYADDNGNSWTGMGPMPKWLKDAVAGGQVREDFLVNS